MEFCLTVLAVALVYWLFNGLTFRRGRETSAPCREQPAVRSGQGTLAGGRGRNIFRRRKASLPRESTPSSFPFC